MFEDLLEFMTRLTAWEWLLYFWPFFFIDFVRYTVMDLVLVPLYIVRRARTRERRAWARRELFRRRPLVSVIAPGRNEGRHIPKLVASLARQTYRNVELIVVDDGSDDDTPEVCRRLEREGHIDLFVRNGVRGGKASAANTALRHARGTFVVHVDADSWLEPEAIERILAPFLLDPVIGGVGGDVRVGNLHDTMSTRLQGIEYMKTISTGRTVSSMLGLLRIIAGAHGAFRRDVLERVGGWDVGPGLDGDITIKIRKLGYRVVHEPSAVCFTSVPSSFRKLARQRYRWDRSLIRFRVRRHRDIFAPNANFRPLNFLSLFENVGLNLVLNVRWWVYILQILVFLPHAAAMIVMVNYLLYTTANLLQFLAAAMLRRSEGGLRTAEALLLPYLALMPAYVGVYLRIVRSYAYLMEAIHRASYQDSWNPAKVSTVSRREDA